MKYLGYGLGLRSEHYEDIITTQPEEVDWFEIITEDFITPPARSFSYLEKIRESYPIVMHGVSMSIGSSAPLDFNYLKKVKELSQRIEAQWLSDHLCWTGVKGKNLHDLLPLPYTEVTFKHVASRIEEVQDFLNQPILLENASTYLEFKQSDIPEPLFLKRLTEKTGCKLLLDINNLYVNAFNHNFNPEAFLDDIPKEAVCQFHLAGHTNVGTHIVDTHDTDVIPAVWDLYVEAVKRFGKVSTMIERDDHIPPLAILLDELKHAKALAEEIEVTA